jgi:hypothetical protein
MSDLRVLPEVAEELRRLADAPLEPARYAELASRRPTAEEMAEMDALLDWFARRYPTAKARLDYARAMTRLWARAMPRR